ncbi:Bromodomain-containing protein [Heracleum sosnowskyi]|uniref:Bromodomain-containing protein n=1 Tax=Heracleum sosnowskyi TaxID=360622 RepID=A0AAD8IU71_9APIA|nr:Bromodomain-containing protein [Heracleum sosnowskyi]
MEVKRGGSCRQDAWRNEASQRSLNAEELHECSNGEENGPPSRTRAKIKRKHLNTAVDDSDSSKTKQGKEKTNQENQSSASRGQPFSAEILPEKHTLELILDVLQRQVFSYYYLQRDTYEIFAEPVDPEKVGDYHKIIKEPMDFGTMRAKLHEGMYATFEQFEHDVFLISGNAMCYNSPGTTYYRQGRAMDELGQKVFYVLKTDPENFESEFSGTRRRSGRRCQGKAKECAFNSNARTSTNFRTVSVTNDISSKQKQSHSSTSRRKLRGIPLVARTRGRCDQYDLFSGAPDDTGSNLDIPDRRSTCTPEMLFANTSESRLAHLYADPRPFLLVNQNDISYIKSLMLFVKDLGPTAQMVARQKLEDTQDKVGQIRDSPLSGWETEIMANTSSDQKVVDLIHNGKHTVINPRNDLLKDKWPDADHGRKERDNNKIGVPHDPICAPSLDERSYDKDNLNRSDKASKRRRKKHHGTNKPSTLDLGLESCPSTFRMINNEGSCSNNHQLVDSVCTIGKHASKSTATSSIRVPPLQDAESWRSRSKAKETTITTIGTTSSPWIMGFSSFSSGLSSKYQGLTVNPSDKNHDPSNRCGGVMMISGSSNNNIMSSSHAKQYPPGISSGSSSTGFTFDIPFLKSQLNQMKVTGQEKDRVEVQRGLFQQLHSSSAEAAPKHGNLCDPKGGYIKVPVHFADQPSSLSAAAAAQSSFHIHKDSQSASRSLSVVHGTNATTFLASIAADDTKLTLKL